MIGRRRNRRYFTNAPLDARAFVAYDGPQLYGDFAHFRAPATSVQANLDEELLTEITRIAAAENLETVRIRGFELDHGTAVPLYFLQRNGWIGHVVALGYTFLSDEDHIRFGNCVRRAIDKLARPVAFIASGDLSHRLKPDAPAGFNPQAHLFDEEVVDAIHRSNPKRIVEIDQEGRRLAGECGYRSILVALGVAEGSEPACEVISYEAPSALAISRATFVWWERGRGVSGYRTPTRRGSKWIRTARRDFHGKQPACYGKRFSTSSRSPCHRNLRHHR